ncbi:UNVERIFIED_CONTAM: hypothetical protein Sradi_7284600 [Sesamum radiatum]|uniref:Secreted protein n=1 Tax=Sesamum radiatum TaxID=300843 RepID=A0AAW2IJ17_SESRA
MLKMRRRWLLNSLAYDLFWPGTERASVSATGASVWNFCCPCRVPSAGIWLETGTVAAGRGSSIVCCQCEPGFCT